MKASYRVWHDVPDQRSASGGGEGVARTDVRVLGAVELIGSRGAVSLPPGARRLLGLLALRPDEPITFAELREAQDPEAPVDPPPGAPTVLAVALARGGLPGALEVGPGRYQLRVPPDRIDALRFQYLLSRARSRMAAGELATAVPLFDAALLCWHRPGGEPGRNQLDGRPLDDVPVRPGSWAEIRIARLVEARLAATEERWECALRLAAAAHVSAGGPAADRAVISAGAVAQESARAAVAALEAAVARHPARHRLWELLLVASFVGAGRRAAAEIEHRAASLLTGMAGRLRVLADAARRGDLAIRWPERLPGGDEQAAPGFGVVRAPVPAPLTALLGREELLADVARRLDAHRLVTLTGPGGAGKTRLAVSVAHRRAGTESWFVDLSAVESPVRVPEAVAAALAVRDEPGREMPETLADAIGRSAALLVLDNCEHLVAGCATLVELLLRRCPGLRILATSRIALRLPAEVTVPVPPLSVPVPGAGLTLAELVAHPGTRLFLERAQACSGRPVPEANADAVARLCAELDGLPLAIELAAARTPLLCVNEIAARLRADLQLLRSPDPTAPTRHRTLAAAVESSVRQLDPGARRLFDQLAVCAGGFDVETAVALVGPTAPVDLAELVDCSLVEPVSSGEAPMERAPADLPAGGRAAPPGEPVTRYRMLVPVRRHALARLAIGEAEVAARRAFATHLLDLAERADARLRGTEQRWWLGRLRTELPNLRLAMTWLAEAGAGAPGHGDLRLASALAMFCRLEGRYREGHGWLAPALARHDDAPVALRATAATGAAMLAMLLCDYPAAVRHAELARDVCRASGDRRGAARVEQILGSVARERARYAESGAHLATAAAIFGECGDEWGEAQTAQLRGFTAWLSGDLARAEPRLRSSLRRYERLGDPEAEATGLMNLGAVALYRGDLDRAESLLDAALRRYQAIGFPEGVGWAHNLSGLVELRRGRTERAAVHLIASLAAHRQIGDRWRAASVLEALAEVARRRGEPIRAARLLGAAARIRDEIGAPVPACERRDTEATSAALRGCLGGPVFAREYRYGKAMPADDLVGDPSGHPPDQPDLR